MTHPHTRPHDEPFPERVAADRERDRIADLLEWHATEADRINKGRADAGMEPATESIADVYRSAAQLVRDSHPTLPVVDAAALSLTTLQLSHEAIGRQPIGGVHPKMRSAVAQGLDELDAAIAQRAAEEDAKAASRSPKQQPTADQPEEA